MDSHLYEDLEVDDNFGICYNEEDDDFFFYDSSKETIKIFACRHTFHLRCLHKYYQQKFKDSKKLQKNKDKLKCPTCNLKDYDIDKSKTVSGVSR